MDLTAILTGIGAILTAAGGVTLVVREFRRRDHVSCNKEIELLSDDLHTAREDNIALRREIHRLRQRLENGE